MIKYKGSLKVGEDLFETYASTEGQSDLLEQEVRYAICKEIFKKYESLIEITKVQ